MDSGSKSTPRPSSPTAASSMHEVVFQAMENVMSACRGGYAGVYLINGIGLVGFRDPNGIRPLVFGVRKSSVSPTDVPATQSAGTEFDANGLPTTPRAAAETKLDFCIASESVVIDALGFKLVRYVLIGLCVCYLSFQCLLNSKSYLGTSLYPLITFPQGRPCR